MTLYKIVNGLVFNKKGRLVQQHHFFGSLDDAEKYADRIFNETKEIVNIEKTDGAEFIKYYSNII